MVPEPAYLAALHLPLTWASLALPHTDPGLYTGSCWVPCRPMGWPRLSVHTHWAEC